MNYEAGDISLVRFPRADLEKGKYRPVLLLAKMPGPFNDWLVCAITSQLRHEVGGWDDRIEETDSDFAGSGLKVPSLIRVGKLATVEEGALEGVLGRISDERLRAILERIADYLERGVGRGEGR
jgi:mRNA interferase MazF